MLTLLLGGARSGKSTLAVDLGRHSGLPVVFVATAEPIDADMATRIARHRDERPPGWATVEAPIELAAAVAGVPQGTFVVVDCLTVWLANLTAHGLTAGQRETAIDGLVDTLRRTGDTVVVSNEVGLGIVPADADTRAYRDDLGRLNQRVAAVADRCLLMVAGRAVTLTDPWTLLA